MDLKRIFKMLVLLCISIASIAVGCLLFLISIVYFIEFSNGSLPNFTYEDAQEVYDANEDELLIVVNLLEKSKLEEVFFGSQEENNILEYVGLSKSEVKLLKDTTDKLFNECGVKSISVYAERINFQMWSSRGNSKGITYTLSDVEVNKQLSVMIEPLNKDDWYFYETN